MKYTFLFLIFTIGCSSTIKNPPTEGIFRIRKNSKSDSNDSNLINKRQKQNFLPDLNIKLNSINPHKGGIFTRRNKNFSKLGVNEIDEEKLLITKNTQLEDKKNNTRSFFLKNIVIKKPQKKSGIFRVREKK
tara:strand:+ start:153 stop:548 length:396 start_codon:yes stop_codon:yes gene_type:complete